MPKFPIGDFRSFIFSPKNFYIFFDFAKIDPPGTPEIRIFAPNFPFFESNPENSKIFEGSWDFGGKTDFGSKFGEFLAKIPFLGWNFWDFIQIIANYGVFIAKFGNYGVFGADSFKFFGGFCDMANWNLLKIRFIFGKVFVFGGKFRNLWGFWGIFGEFSFDNPPKFPHNFGNFQNFGIIPGFFPPYFIFIAIFNEILGDFTQIFAWFPIFCYFQYPNFSYFDFGVWKIPNFPNFPFEYFRKT